MATDSSTLAWRIPWMEEPVGYSPWGPEESGTTERLHFLFFLSFYTSQNWNLRLDCRNSSLVIDL